MKFKKPNFWDYRKPNLISYLLLPFTLPFIINNFFLSLKNKKKRDRRIKSICIGNIYVGGTTKTPSAITVDKILKKINLKTATIKKFYSDQIDEQELLKKNTNLYCYNTRKKSIDEAIKDNNDVAIFDDGLQDPSINYDLTFVCFNNSTWIGNGFLMPAGPLREKIDSIKKYDAIFLNGNGENVSNLKLLIKKINKDIMIFETQYVPLHIKKFDLEKKYIVFSGIGNPENFKKTLINNNFDIIKEIKFPDHYQYKLSDINKIKILAKKFNAKIITTEKDYIKIDLDYNNGIEFLEVDLIIKNENELINFIKSKI